MLILNMNDYIKIEKCRCCDSRVECLLDLGNQPLANSYHKNDKILKKYPLQLNICFNCFHTQLSVVVNPDIMFKNYLYVSGTSQTLKTYFDFFAKFTVERFKYLNNKKPKNVLDIACNDGTQLNYFKNLGIITYGIDPAENLYHISKKEHNIICDYFPSEKINDKKYDLVIAQNVFAHTDNVNDFLKKIVEILSDDGILYIQTSQSNMILNNEFDTIYHEHLSFFNSMSMKILIEKNGLKLNNVFKFDIHGSSYIFEISKKTVDSNIESIINNEKNNGLYDIKTYEKFAKNAQKIVLNLKNEIKKFKDNDYLIIGYGAAAKGMTVLNFGDIQMDYIIDDNPLKCNLYTPGTNILITDINILKNIDKKILFIPLAWNFYNEIVNKIQIIRKNSNDIFLNYFPDISINNNKI